MSEHAIIPVGIHMLTVTQFQSLKALLATLETQERDDLETLREHVNFARLSQATAAVEDLIGEGPADPFLVSVFDEIVRLRGEIG